MKQIRSYNFRIKKQNNLTNNCKVNMIKKIITLKNNAMTTIDKLTTIYKLTTMCVPDV